MAGSITVTSEELRDINGNRVWKYAIDWLSDASGDVSGNTFDLPTGELVEVAYTPDGGATAPTDAYDVTMTDPNGADTLAGTGANLSGTVATVVVPVISTYFRRFVYAGTYTPVVANAGNAKGGLIILLIR